ncbi:MAG: PQQ-like beta-propeller repeat protein [Armatimonadaceae bacterium]
MADWPQWRGPKRDGISTETVNPWSGGGPRQVWKARTGEGFSSMAVAGGKVYTMGNFRDEDYVLCYDASSGKMVWQYKYPCGSGDYAGPRATPTVHQSNVYTVSREGTALCLNAANGKLVWKREAARETGAGMPQWGFAGSPLIQGNLVILNIGSAGMALDKTNGRIVWKSGGGPAGYASPVPFTAGGQSGVAIFAGKGLVALNPTTGRKFWQHPWDTSFDVNAADPIFVGDTVFISSNYGKGGALVRIAGGKTTELWRTRDMKNHFNTCVLVGKHLYGNDEGRLRCIDLGNGRDVWQMRGMDKGGLIAAGDKLIALTGEGELVLISANPSAFKELARARVLDGTCWTHPVLANGLLYCRSHQGDLVCLDLK